MPRKKFSYAQEMARFSDERSGNLLTNVVKNVPLFGAILGKIRRGK